MKIQNYILVLFIALLSFSIAACSDDDKDNMVWDVVSNSNPEGIEVVNNTSKDFESPSVIWVRADYKEGDLVLRCINHSIAFSLIGPNDSYVNPECGFSISKIDDSTLSIHFDRNASGKSECSDQITITNSDQKPVVCNTFLNITRTFGELQPQE